MKKFALFCLLFFSLPSFASDGLYDGCCVDGYCYHSADGYWWKDKHAYTRSKYYYTENSYSCGYCYPQSYYWWNWHPVATPTPAVTSADPDWRNKLLDIAAARDQFEGKQRERSNEHNMFLEATNALGLTGNFNWQNYGIAPTLAYPLRSYGQQNLQLGHFGAQGNTLYGYSYSTVADVYGNSDPALLYQQAAALAKNSQDLGGQATTQFQGLVQADGLNRSRVAEILAKGQTSERTLNASNAQASATVVTQGQGYVPGQTQTTLAFSGNRGRAIGACIGCHGGNSPKGGYAVESHWSLSPEQQMGVVQRLLAEPNDPKYMPRLPNGGPGPRLPSALIMEFLPASERSRAQ